MTMGDHTTCQKRTTPQHTNEVTILKVEAVQLVARRLRIHGVFIDDKSCSLGVAGDALANLPDGASVDVWRCGIISHVARSGWRPPTTKL